MRHWNVSRNPRPLESDWTELVDAFLGAWEVRDKYETYYSESRFRILGLQLFL